MFCCSHNLIPIQIRIQILFIILIDSMFTRTFAHFLRLISSSFAFSTFILRLHEEIHSPLSEHECVSRFTFIRHQGSWEKEGKKSTYHEFLRFQLICFHFSSFRVSEMDGRNVQIKFLIDWISIARLLCFALHCSASFPCTRTRIKLFQKVFLFSLTTIIITISIVDFNS